jgi:iron complex outermembrane receptor protein
MLALTAAAFATPAFAQANPDDTIPTEDTDEEVVITARRQALQDATERKRNSDTMIDSVVADDAGHLPDTSITEVLQRVSGVTMVRFNLGDPDSFNVEGSGVQVRGLSGVTSLLNGREVFSANGGSGLSWGDVTPELMAAVDVFKATRSDMIAGGIGGAIDLRTKTPFDYDGFGFELAASASRGDLAEITSPSMSVLMSNRWETSIGEMGLLVDIAHSEFSSRSFNIGAEPFYRQLDPSGASDRFVSGGFGYGDDRFNRTRDGFYEAFEWHPTNQLSFFQTIFVSEYESDNTGASVFANTENLGPAPGANAIYDSNGALVQADRLIAISRGQGNQGSTIGQGWIPANQQVDCNAPYGDQAQSLNWGTSPPTCVDQKIFAGSARAFGASESSTRDFSQGFTWEGERLHVRGVLQYVESTVDSNNFYAGTEAQLSAISMDLRGEFPEVRVLDPSELSDPANYIWASMGSRAQHNRGIMYAGYLDAEYKLDGFFTEISAGLQYADRKEKDDYDGTYWAALGRGWNGSAQRTLADGPLDDTELYPFDNFFRGDVGLPGQFWLPSASMLQQRGPVYAQTQYGYNNECATGAPVVIGCAIGVAPLYYPDEGGPLDGDPHSLTQTSPDTRAFYVQTRFESESGLFGVPYNGNFGVRVVQNKVEASGYFVLNEARFYLTQADANADATDGVADNYLSVPLTGVFQQAENEYTRYLPAFNVNFNLTDDLFLRFAVNRTMSPPAYYDLRASGSANVTTTANPNNTGVPGATVYPNILQSFSANAGNPYLLPTLSDNLDLSLEWYGDNANLHVSVFNKDLEDFIVYQDNTRPITITINEVDGTTRTHESTISTAEIVNAEENATIRGFEIGGRKFFDELPGWLSGFGIEANYTYVDSDNPSAKALDIDGQPMDDIPVTGLSENNFNVQFLYEKYDWSLRAAYTWRDRYLTSTNSNGTNGDYDYYNDTTTGGDGDTTLVDISLPVYAEAYGQWDVGATYQVSEKLRLWVQGSNVTNETAETTQGGYPNGALYPRNYFVHDRRISAGINFSF